LIYLTFFGKSEKGCAVRCQQDSHQQYPLRRSHCALLSVTSFPSPLLLLLRTAGDRTHLFLSTSILMLVDFVDSRGVALIPRHVYFRPRAWREQCGWIDPLFRILPKVPVPVNSVLPQRTFLTPSLIWRVVVCLDRLGEPGICQGRLRSICPYRSQHQNR